jgi:ABC-type polysaccharide/polyol phosphate transport system ATPase subunit
MPVIEVSHLTKEYRLGALQGLKQTLLNTGARLVGKPVPERPLFKALDDVSFSIEQGEVVGIIGHNGAGKSTLLKMLARISTPTSGAVRVNGRIAPLIEVGAGFVPDFTGRENVYLNGSILGMSRQEIDRKFDEIVDFAEMAEFIDTPVKRYSSGMQVKLAFAVATSIESEILIVDEVLAVGDLAFQRKCFDRMEDLIRRGGRTVLIVSHNIRQIERMCQRVLLLDHGHVDMDGPAGEICNAFYARNDDRIISQHTNRKLMTTGEVELLSLSLFDSNGLECSEFEFNSDIHFRIKLKFNAPQINPRIVLGIHTTDFINLSTHVSRGQDLPSRLEPGIHEFWGKMDHLPLLPGVYAMRISIDVGEIVTNIFYADHICNFKVTEADFQRSGSESEGFFRLHVKWNEAPEPLTGPHLTNA